MKSIPIIPLALAVGLSAGALAQDDPELDTGARADSYEPNVIPTGEAETDAAETDAAEVRSPEETADTGADPRRGEDHPLAQGSEHAVDGQPREFTEVDKDGNGLLSIEEAREALPERLEITDANGDGLLNREEVQSAMPELSFAGGSPNEPVGPNDYQIIRDQLSGESPAASPGPAATADPETVGDQAGGEADPVERDDDAI